MTARVRRGRGSRALPFPEVPESGNGSIVTSNDEVAGHSPRSRVTRRISTLRLVREGSFAAPDGYPDSRTPIRTPRDVYQLMAPYAAREVGESFWILTLDALHRVSAPTVVTRGILNASLVHPREVFVAAMLAGAVAIVLVHNHPSGASRSSEVESYAVE